MTIDIKKLAQTEIFSDKILMYAMVYIVQLSTNHAIVAYAFILCMREQIHEHNGRNGNFQSSSSLRSINRTCLQLSAILFFIPNSSLIAKELY